MTRDELEFSISQYHDGTLPPLETRAIEELLATNAEARQVLSEYQKLDTLMASTPSVPALDWDRLHTHLSQTIAQVPDEQAPAVKTYKIGLAWTRYVGVAAAVAAAIAIVVTVVFRDQKPATDTTVATRDVHIQIGPAATGSLTEIVATSGIGVTARSNPGASVTSAEVSVGPSPQVAGMAWGYDDGILERPARVVIAGDAQPAQDVSSPIPD
jgi:anti-sigma factor RsiW